MQQHHPPLFSFGALTVRSLHRYIATDKIKNDGRLAAFLVPVLKENISMIVGYLQVSVSSSQDLNVVEDYLP